MTDNYEDLDLDHELEHEAEQQLFEHHKVIADKGQGLLRVDKFLTNHIEALSRSKIQEAADCGYLRVNGKAVKSNYKVKPFDAVTIEFEQPKRELKIIPEDIPLDIIFEDDDLIVINKPPGLVVHPGHGNYTGTLVNALAFHFKELPLFQSQDPRPGLVHRIDKDTSGLLVIAKNELAKNSLARQFFDKTTKRLYKAIVWGVPKETEGTVSSYIGRNLKDRKVMHVFPDDEHGKWAVTHYKVHEELGYCSVIECRLETGRTHQIRVHMKHIGHTIFNDSTYGGDRVLRGTTFSKYKQFVTNCFGVCPRQCLHAQTLGFIHPRTGEQMLFESAVPADMQSLIDKWRIYVSHRSDFDNGAEELGDAED
jgi:23S rRNA pseudouridine1911/1915/1917 synthase